MSIYAAESAHHSVNHCTVSNQQNMSMQCVQLDRSRDITPAISWHFNVTNYSTTHDEFVLPFKHKIEEFDSEKFWFIRSRSLHIPVQRLYAGNNFENLWND
jgi:hypothetical protein